MRRKKTDEHLSLRHELEEDCQTMEAIQEKKGYEKGKRRFEEVKKVRA